MYNIHTRLWKLIKWLFGKLQLNTDIFNTNIHIMHFIMDNELYGAHDICPEPITGTISSQQLTTTHHPLRIVWAGIIVDYQDHKWVPVSSWLRLPLQLGSTPRLQKHGLGTAPVHRNVNNSRKRDDRKIMKYIIK